MSRATSLRLRCRLSKLTVSRQADRSGDLTFLNDWSYKLGAELLTPFGREELFNLGVSFRVKYGHLLNNEGSEKLPVFRTESQDRMLNSAKNFAAGFFGCTLPYPLLSTT